MSEPGESKPKTVAVRVRNASAVMLRPVPIQQRLVAMMMRWSVALPVLALSAGLLGWSWTRRASGNPLPVRARTLPSRTPHPTNQPALSRTELRALVQRSSQSLLPRREEATRFLADWEREGRRLGFQVSVTAQPSITNVAGFKELTVIPAVVQLENDFSRTEPAYGRLLEWLGRISAAAKRIEVTALDLRSRGDGLATARVELQFWSSNLHEEAAAK